MNGVHKVLPMFLHKFVRVISKYLPGQKNVPNKSCRNNEGLDPTTNFFLQVLRFSRYFNKREGMHQNCAFPNLLVPVTESTSKHVITFYQWHMKQFKLHCHQLSFFTLSTSPSVFTYQTRVRNKTLVPKREQANEGWWKLRNGELPSLAFLTNITRKIK
jgi:hypothetical protein